MMNIGGGTSSTSGSGLTTEQREIISNSFQAVEIDGNNLKFTTEEGDVLIDITSLITDIKVNGATLNNKVLTLNVDGGGDIIVDLSQFVTNQELEPRIDNRLVMYLLSDDPDASLERDLADAGVFNSFYNIAEIDPGNPFFGGANSSSVTSQENSPLGLPYEIYTCNNSAVSFILHMGVSQGFTPVVGRSYQVSILARGVGSSVGKRVTMGVVREGDRLENTVTLPEYWSILQTDAYPCTSGTFVLYVHLSERGGNMVSGEQIEVMAYYVREEV